MVMLYFKSLPHAPDSCNRKCILEVKFEPANDILEKKYLIKLLVSNLIYKYKINFMILYTHTVYQNEIRRIYPLTPMSDQGRISPYNINTTSTR